MPLDAVTDWCLIIDESVSIGRERLLLVLGVPLKDWAFNRPLTHADVTVVKVAVSESWKSGDIQKIIGEITDAVKVRYIVSDRGNNIVSAIKKSDLPHVDDCGHEWARIMETLYAGNESFKALMANLGMIRKRWALGRYSHLMPPPLRSKARFLNVFPLITWIEEIWRKWDDIAEEGKQELSFLEEFRPHIEEWTILKTVVGEMARILKSEGLNSGTIERCKTMLDEKCTVRGTVNFAQIQKSCWERYLDMTKSEKEDPEKDKASIRNYICSSDIIESYFGRFKQKIKGAGSITEMILSMCTWNKKFSIDEIEEALENTKLKEINSWKKENTTDSLIKKRREFFTQNCMKTAA